LERRNSELGKEMEAYELLSTSASEENVDVTDPGIPTGMH
jgi:hypothetical protein